MSFEQRKVILNTVYKKDEKKDDKWMMKKLLNAFSFNREEICGCIKLLINKCKTKNETPSPIDNTKDFIAPANEIVKHTNELMYCITVVQITSA